MSKVRSVPALVHAFVGLLFVLGASGTVKAQEGFVDPDIAGVVTDVILEPGGKILVAGSFANVAGQSRGRVARLNVDGTLDTTFQDPQVIGTDPFNTYVWSMARQSDGKIVIGGNFVSVRGQTQNYLARLNADGTLDTGFTPAVSAAVTAVALQPDGKVLLGGYFATANGQARNRMARLNSDGSLDTSFADPQLTAVSGYAVGTIYPQPDGKILIGGYFNSIGGQGKMFGARLEQNGSVDNSFNFTVSGPVEQFTIQPDGKILICGFISFVNGEPRRGIARINPDGSLDPTFGNTAIPSGSISAFGLQTDGKIVVGGSFSTISGHERRDLARLNSDSTFDTTFQDVNANFGGSFTTISSVLIQPDGKILVGGQFITVGRQTRKNLVRLLPNGTLDLPPAQVLTVTKTADTNDGFCDSDCSLREAISTANATLGAGSVINFDPGVFGTSQTIALTLGELFVEQDRRVSIAGPGATGLTISGNNASRILRLKRDAIVSISGVTLSNGNGIGEGSVQGGAVYVEPNGVITSLTIANAAISDNTAFTGAGIRTFGLSNLTISNSTLSGNVASGNPGGGAIVFDNGTLNITNTTISNNQSTLPGGAGGGINVTNASAIFNLTDSVVNGNIGGGVGAGGTATITNTTITNNQSAVWGAGLYSGGTVNLINSTVAGNSVTNSDGQGGGIVNYGRLTVTNSLITANSAAFGGGIFTAGALTMTGTTVSNNTSSKTGGGIYNNAGGTSGLPVSLTSCVIHRNIAAEFAGGIQNRDAFAIEGSTISDNIASLGGGGIYNVFVTGSGAVMSITRSTMTGNRSNAGGGAIQNQAGTVSLANSTVSRNTAGGAGGGMVVLQNGVVNLSFATVGFNIANSVGGIRITSGTVNANNSIIARNIGRNTGADFSGQLNSEGYNLIGDLADTSIIGDTTGNIVNVNPRLDPVLRNNGGLTLTHALEPNSPAIDAGKSLAGLNTDQRGSVRPFDFGSIPNAPGGNGADMGSFERSATDVARFVSPFDFDGDGRTDVGIFRPSVAEWWINRSSTGVTFAAQFGASTDKIVPADFTGDGKTDIAVWRPSTGEWLVLRSDDSSFYAAPFGTVDDIPVPADYDADGTADIAVFRPSNGTWYVLRSASNTRIEQFGINGDIPVPADYDGDGRADLAIFRPSIGQWWLNRSTAGVIAYDFGNSTDKTVPGDYTGDGRSDVALWRPSTGEWYILRSEDTSFYSAPFGINGDVPAAGDYDGDGKFDVTVFRPSSATWYSQRSTAGTLIQQFGAAGDRPVASAFVP